MTLKKIAETLVKKRYSAAFNAPAKPTDAESVSVYTPRSEDIEAKAKEIREIVGEGFEVKTASNLETIFITAKK